MTTRPQRESPQEQPDSSAQLIRLSQEITAQLRLIEAELQCIVGEYALTKGGEIQLGYPLSGYKSRANGALDVVQNRLRYLGERAQAMRNTVDALKLE